MDGRQPVEERVAMDASADATGDVAGAATAAGGAHGVERSATATAAPSSPPVASAAAAAAADGDAVVDAATPSARKRSKLEAAIVPEPPPSPPPPPSARAPRTYRWTLRSRPAHSTAGEQNVLHADTPMALLQPDVPGLYELQLEVRSGGDGGGVVEYAEVVKVRALRMHDAAPADDRDKEVFAVQLPHLSTTADPPKP